MRSKLWKSFCATLGLKLEKATEVRRVQAEEWARWREGPVRGGSIAVGPESKIKKHSKARCWERHTGHYLESRYKMQF